MQRPRRSGSRARRARAGRTRAESSCAAGERVARRPRSRRRGAALAGRRDERLDAARLDEHVVVQQQRVGRRRREGAREARVRATREAAILASGARPPCRRAASTAASRPRPRCRRGRAARPAPPRRGGRDRRRPARRRAMRRRRRRRSQAASLRARAPATVGAVQRVLITGADGFVGRHLRSAPRRARTSRRSRRRPTSATPTRWPTRSRARPDAVAHLAGVTSVADAWGREREVWDVNATRHAERRARRRRARARGAPARRLVGGGLRAHRRGRGAGRRGPPARARLALRPLEGRRRARLRARRPRRRGRARPSRTPGPGRPRRSRSRRSPAQIARIEAGVAPPSIKVGNLDARRDYSRRALRRRRLRRGCSSSAAGRASSTSPRGRRTACARCSTGCSPWPRVEIASRSIRRACDRRTSRCWSGRPAGSPRRPVGGQPGRSTKHSRTCWTPRDKE